MEGDSRIYFDPPETELQLSIVKAALAEAADDKGRAGGKIVTVKEVLFGAPAKGASAFGGSKSGAKHYLQKIAKLVPIEIVGSYEAAILFAGGVKPDSARIWIYWTLFGLGLVGTLWYVGWRIGDRLLKQRHLVVYGAAYIVWAYAISGERLLPFPYYQDAIAAVLLVVASAIFGKVKLPRQEKATVKKSASTKPDR